MIITHVIYSNFEYIKERDKARTDLDTDDHSDTVFRTALIIGQNIYITCSKHRYKTVDRYCTLLLITHALNYIGTTTPYAGSSFKLYAIIYLEISPTCRTPRRVSSVVVPPVESLSIIRITCKHRASPFIERCSLYCSLFIDFNCTSYS